MHALSFHPSLPCTMEILHSFQSSGEEQPIWKTLLTSYSAWSVFHLQRLTLRPARFQSDGDGSRSRAPTLCWPWAPRTPPWGPELHSELPAGCLPQGTAAAQQVLSTLRAGPRAGGRERLEVTLPPHMSVGLDDTFPVSFNSFPANSSLQAAAASCLSESCLQNRSCSPQGPDQVSSSKLGMLPMSPHVPLPSPATGMSKSTS